MEERWGWVFFQGKGRMGELGFLSRWDAVSGRRVHAAVLALVVALMTALAGTAQGGPGSSSEAAALEQQGKFPEAETAWRAVLASHPSSAEACAHLGLLEARQEHYKEAIPLYRRALGLNPAMPGLRLNLGLALFKGGDLRGAIHEFTLLKTRAPDSPDVQRLNILIGMAHYGLGEYAEAAPFLKTAAAVDTQNLQLRLALAHSCLWSKQYQCVLDTYHEILTLNAESAEADMLAGEAEDEMKDYDGAIKEFRAAVKADPKEPDVHFGLGYIYWTQRDYPEAAGEFQAELANNPDHAQALAYLGDTEIQLNHPELAPPLFKKAIAIDPKIALAHLDQGVLDADAKRMDDALRELTWAAKLEPDDVNVHWRLGRLYKIMGKKTEAKAEFDKASSLHQATNDALLERMSGAHGKPAPAQDQAPAQ
jgi:tetratricopeptide (TPR) repeat protein